MDNTNYWPYTNIHELNLDWIIAKVKELDTRFTDDIESFVQEYINEHFAEWTVAANYDPNDETIIYTNGTGATLTAGDVIRFAIDNAFVNVKDPTARTAASNAAVAAAAAQDTADDAVTAAAAAQSTADRAAAAAATAQNTANSAVTAAATAQSTADGAVTALDSKVPYVDVMQITASTLNEAVGAAWDRISITGRTVIGHFSYGGDWAFMAYKTNDSLTGSMIALRHDQQRYLLFVTNGTKTYKFITVDP